MPPIFQRLKKELINIFILLALSSINIASASQGDRPNKCYDSDVLEESSLQLATIVGQAGTKIPFQHDYDDGKWDDIDGCPSLDPKVCPVKRYLVPGDVVVKARDYKEFSCVWYRSKKEPMTGWVPTSHLNIIPTSSQPALQQWEGRWSDWNDEITIQESDDGFLKLEGKASWGGGGYSVHVGSFSALGKAKGNQIKVIETEDGRYAETVNDEEAKAECIVNLTLVGDYLIARDNFHCGGVNVRFFGVYWRALK